MNEQFLVEEIYERELNLAEEYERENALLSVDASDNTIKLSHRPFYGAVNN